MVPLKRPLRRGWGSRREVSPPKLSPQGKGLPRGLRWNKGAGEGVPRAEAAAGMKVDGETSPPPSRPSSLPRPPGLAPRPAPGVAPPPALASPGLAAGAASPVCSGGLKPHGWTRAPAPHSLVVLLCHRACSPLPGRRTGLSGWDSTPDPGGGGGGGGGGSGSGAAAPTGWVRFSRSEPAPRGLRALGARARPPIGWRLAGPGRGLGTGRPAAPPDWPVPGAPGRGPPLRVAASVRRAPRSRPVSRRDWRGRAAPARTSRPFAGLRAPAALGGSPEGQAVPWRPLLGPCRSVPPRQPTEALRAPVTGPRSPGSAARLPWVPSLPGSVKRPVLVPPLGPSPLIYEASGFYLRKLRCLLPRRAHGSCPALEPPAHPSYIGRYVTVTGQPLFPLLRPG